MAEGEHQNSETEGSKTPRALAVDLLRQGIEAGSVSAAIPEQIRLGCLEVKRLADYERSVLVELINS